MFLHDCIDIASDSVDVFISTNELLFDCFILTGKIRVLNQISHLP